MNENWYVFMVAILAGVGVETSFRRWDKGKINLNKRKVPRDVIDRIMALREDGMNFSEIGRELGIKEYTVRDRVSIELMRRDFMA